jgi:hypothetical protein
MSDRRDSGFGVAGGLVIGKQSASVELVLDENPMSKPSQI